MQVRPLDRWPDGSIRWALIDFSTPGGTSAGESSLLVGRGIAAPPPADGVRVSPGAHGIGVETNGVVFDFANGGAFPISSIERNGEPLIDPKTSGFRVELENDVLDLAIGDVHVNDAGPARAEIEMRGVVQREVQPLVVFARVEIFAGSAAARIAITIRNPRPARHPGGQWVLGDEGSIFIRSATFALETADPIERVRCAVEWGDALKEFDLPLEIYQESSGGEHWNGPIHRNREGRVPLRFRGYRARSGSRESSGNRASPVVVASTVSSAVAVAVPQFWENFPRAISVEPRRIEIGLFPRQAPDVHELQGGEQKTHVIVIQVDSAAADAAATLAWCHDPLLLYPDAAWCCSTGAIPFLTPASPDPDPHQRLIAIALDPVDGFTAKNERADEYGWRNFGDLHADHESARQPPDRPFVSHYNNQYDAIAGFGLQFLRSGDARWWRLMNDLAQHVRDVDIYHTSGDKAAYNGGLFWHTQHYTDAGTSTHRTYPRGSSGGGPASEHNYNAGLMLHYFMTGDRASREAAIGLGQWVIDMDDGRRTPLRWIASGPTGFASASGSMHYHGPGRGSGNSILACLVAHRLTGDRSFSDKADELIRRCIHPDDDVDARELHDVERRWFYTVFLQSLGVYLHDKDERGERDPMYAYARASLLHYAQWMATNERPYLERPEILEFPTETWAAQDMRKAEVFWWAALHTSGEERERFLERARFFFEYSTTTLARMPTSRYTRPTVLMLQNGWRAAWSRERVLPEATPAASGSGHWQPTRFVPQKNAAMRRVRAAGLVAAALAVLAAWALIT